MHDGGRGQPRSWAGTRTPARVPPRGEPAGGAGSVNGVTEAGWAEDLALACELAEAADATSLPRFGAVDLRVDSKPDLTPVTDADLAVERVLRDILAQRRPADAVIGEESVGVDDGDSADARSASVGRCWVIDPIDGTKNFVRGVPVWASLIALLVDGRPVLGAVSAPALARRWWGGDGMGARTAFAGGQPRPCRVSGVANLADASLSLSDVTEWEDAGLGGQLRKLIRSCWRSRGYGDFYSYMLVAEGAVDIAAEPELALWDVAALAPIVIAAGGRLTTLDGAPIGPESASALATNGPLHEPVRAMLASAQARPSDEAAAR